MRTRVKICGITRAEDLVASVEAGADAIGLVFYPGSARALTIEAARQLIKEVPPFVSTVGLFVNADAVLVNTAIDKLRLDILQFHGDEDAAYCQQFSRPWIKALRVTRELNLLEYAARYKDAAGLLLDADVAGFGGGGKTFDWSLISPDLPRSFILSGGLSADNVADAVLKVRPWAVDVSSGVEALDGKSKGIKDVIRITQFIAEVVRADAVLNLKADKNANARHVL